MKYALVSDQRIEAQPKLQGLCPYCKSPVKSKCGKVKIWHWAHESLTDCDTWWESETEWHRKWKNYFSKENQEVIHYDMNTNEKHIADVKTNNGMIIEFQNSPMNIDELTSRETFYGNMFWVINGIKFINSFNILEPIPNPDDPEMKEIALTMPYNGKCYQGYSLVKDIEQNDGMVRLYPTDKIKEKAYETNSDFFFFEWKNPRFIWYEALKPVFFDFGEDNLFLLKQYNRQRLRCVRKISKKKLIEKNGGKYIEI